MTNDETNLAGERLAILAIDLGLVLNAAAPDVLSALKAGLTGPDEPAQLKIVKGVPLGRSAAG